eukprot:363144-Chlamydomonas_euryale.AAC.1
MKDGSLPMRCSASALRLATLAGAPPTAYASIHRRRLPLPFVPHTCWYSASTPPPNFVQHSAGTAPAPFPAPPTLFNTPAGTAAAPPPTLFNTVLVQRRPPFPPRHFVPHTCWYSGSSTRSRAAAAPASPSARARCSTGSRRAMSFSSSGLRNLISTMPSGSSTPPLRAEQQALAGVGARRFSLLPVRAKQEALAGVRALRSSQGCALKLQAKRKALAGVSRTRATRWVPTQERSKSGSFTRVLCPRQRQDYACQVAQTRARTHAAKSGFGGCKEESGKQGGRRSRGKIGSKVGGKMGGEVGGKIGSEFRGKMGSDVGGKSPGLQTCSCGVMFGGHGMAEEVGVQRLLLTDAAVGWGHGGAATASTPMRWWGRAWRGSDCKHTDAVVVVVGQGKWDNDCKQPFPSSRFCR